MTLTLIPPTTTLPASVQSYLLGWSPDHDARQWMKAQTPLWVPHVPIDVLAKKYAITPDHRKALAGRIIADSVKRFGYCSNPAAYMQQACARPDWPFTWPDSPQQWRLAPQETTLAHVLWAIQNGYPEEGFHVLALQFLAYQLHGWWDPADKTNPAKWYDPKFEMTPSQWSELRNGGNAAQNYGTAGRHRHVRGCIDYAVHALNALAYFGVHDGPQVEYLQTKLAWHVENLHAKFPLIDDPRSDHFGPTTPFVSVYQTAALRSILEAAKSVANDAAWTKANDLLMRIDGLLLEFGPVSSVADVPLSQWFYDIPFENGKPRKVVVNEKGAQINYGISGVAAYLVPMLAEATADGTFDYFLAMRNDAKAKNWPTLHPVETAWAFGKVTL